MYASAIKAVPLDTLDDSFSSSDGQLDRTCEILRLDGALLVNMAGTIMAQGGAAPPEGMAELIAANGWCGMVHVVADTEAGTPLGLQSAARFVATIPIPDLLGPTRHTLVLWDRRPRSLAGAHRLLNLAVEVTAQATLTRLNGRRQHDKFMFERASQTARIGIWICTLPDNEITWTNGVYDLFEMPHGAPLIREQTVSFYTAESRRQMEALRMRAIAEGSDFCMDAEIVTARGNRRWMRLTGAVEMANGVATRIFGMKQDITEEKQLTERTRYLAEFDVMTGLANRSQFQNRINDLDGHATGKPIGGLLVVDLDGFKQINDTYGHAAGDEYLKEASRRLLSCFAGADLVARIGGDEFAILIGTGTPLDDIERQAAHAIAAISGKAIVSGQTLHMGLSIGVAHRSSTSGEDLFRQADAALYAAKAAGRGTYRVYGR